MFSNQNQFQSRSIQQSALAVALIVMAGCSQNKTTALPEPAVQKIQTQSSGSGVSLVAATGVAPKINAQITLNKAAILDQDFFYGADLQYSSSYDADSKLYNQSLAQGHVPARFRIAGGELQLVADQKRLYPSDVNHPEQLISRYRILFQNDDSITVSIANSSVFLTQLTNGTKSPAPKDLWARSIEYVAADRLLLQETSIVQVDGAVLEFMESVFPQQMIAPGKEFEKIVMDPDHPAGGEAGVVNRYRLLPGETIRDGERSLAMAQHYDISDGKTIDWYVTPNIPDQYVAAVAQSVVGWNRYFKNFKGIERDVVRFLGRMPTGMKLGDPRFNIINWDSRTVAGAAYESQANDPFTGKQSHSLIYMPAAWFKIGTDYWQHGQYTEGPIDFSKPDSKLGSPSDSRMSKIACLRDLRDSAALSLSGRLSKSELEVFGIELLKQTLFHEVGHALGLAHNFKGSLSYDPDSAASIFSTSIMDYNLFEIERQAFQSENSAEGPQLEYDRQTLSAIYNRMKDVSAKDAIVPTCNDNEADDEDGGVDPLCTRYDVEKDPTRGVTRAIELFNSADPSNKKSVAAILRTLPARLLVADELKDALDESSQNELVDSFISAMRAVLRHATTIGRDGIGRTASTQIRMLQEFKDDALPGDFSAEKLRTIVRSAVSQVVMLDQLPVELAKAIADLSNEAGAILIQTPYAYGLSVEAKAKLQAETLKKLLSVGPEFVKNEAYGLAKLKAQVLAAMKVRGAPYYFGSLNGETIDIDSEFSSLVLAVVVDPSRTDIERTTAATALKSYSVRPLVMSKIEEAKTALKSQLKAAQDRKARTRAEIVLKALG